MTTRNERIREQTEGDSNNNKNANGVASASEPKSLLCIGSIFGIDVGGSLAKLAYFESNELMVAEANNEAATPSEAHRQRAYRASASAHAVCMARRSSEEQGFLNGRHRFSFHDEPTVQPDPINNNNNEPPQPRRQRQRRQRSKSLCSSAHIWAPPVRTESPHEPPRVSPHPLLKHSDSSNDDLQNLARLRQESVPDDLDAFAQASGHTPSNLFGQQWRSTSNLDADSKENNSDNHHDATTNATNDANTEKPPSMRKVRSMVDLSFTSKSDHAEALDRFYNFARRLDSYREGVRDHKLSFYSHELGGEFHFIRFETRRMQNAMDLIRANKLHLNIHKMGGTGGGAHKFAARWRDELGIEMEKQDELDSLVAGMQFVLSTVVGECYTFRPAQAHSPSTTTVAECFG